MNYIIFDNFRRNYLLPISFTRPVADIRIGILTIRQKWEKQLNSKTSSLTEEYLGKNYPIEKADNNILINGSVCPNDKLVEQVKSLKPKEALITGNTILAMHVEADDLEKIGEGETHGIKEIEIDAEYIKLNESWDIFARNSQAIHEDFNFLTTGRKSAPISPTNKLIDQENIFFEEGAKAEHCIINASAGPVYIGKDAEIMEGAMIRGPVAICENSTVKMGAKIYGGTTIGPYCKVGGEINNCVFIGYSNKAHDGYLGNSVIGEWCNIGAGTSNSNLKNTYDEVRLWSYPEQTFIRTGLQFCGLIMGDHTKCGINTTFNTGTVIGVSANVYGPGFQRNFIASFTWGGTSGFQQYDFEKAIDVAKVVYQRRNREFTQNDRDILFHVFKESLKNKKV
ncbi:MAG: GlmU family protein [Bacteroidales bacterium]|nr:GlmU family protein [Bacteroidales bacterium]MCF8344375.1 GlmU family protein [Bacteroidales bacterium]MCF8352506.1 GlmU family protein [Bacteroidales bacterium]MCF8377199.1 GlmU family protein [Bacteroidales bacterium]MCF8401070.1 GlmU family protein [Bacteroidales bacterium]